MKNQNHGSQAACLLDRSTKEEINIYDQELIRSTELYLKELQSSYVAFKRQVDECGTINQSIKNDELIDAIKLVRKAIKKDLWG